MGNKVPIFVRNNKVYSFDGQLDTIVSSRGKNKGCLATFVECENTKIASATVNVRSDERTYTNSFLKTHFKTYAVHRGKEFACYSKVEADLKVPVYFADAYSSWQRGSNENANGLLREFFPKKTDLA